MAYARNEVIAIFGPRKLLADIGEGDEIVSGQDGVVEDREQNGGGQSTGWSGKYIGDERRPRDPRSSRRRTSSAVTNTASPRSAGTTR